VQPPVPLNKIVTLLELHDVMDPQLTDQLAAEQEAVRVYVLDVPWFTELEPLTMQASRGLIFWAFRLNGKLYDMIKIIKWRILIVVILIIFRSNDIRLSSEYSRPGL
jgi:hypothetical protein